MRYDDEEQFIVDKLLSARYERQAAENQMRSARIKLNQAEKHEADCEQALVDYYVSCGVTKSTCGDFNITLGTSVSVDVTDIDSVPEKYIRTKVSKEVNKQLIRAENLPESNWLRYERKPTITIKHIKES